MERLSREELVERQKEFNSIMRNVVQQLDHLFVMLSPEIESRFSQKTQGGAVRSERARDIMIFEGAGTVMPVWQIPRIEPGFIYIIEHHGLYKIGKTTRAKERLKAAKTWLPDMNLLGFKPFWGMSHHERLLHVGFAYYWYSGEWYKFGDDEEARDLLLEGFLAFSDNDPDNNSRDFIYWYNGEGMAELQMAMNQEGSSLRKFQKTESTMKKNSDWPTCNDLGIDLT